MAKFIAVHTLLKSPDEVMKAFGELSPPFAKVNASGKAPAKCIKTWNPIPHGRTDYVFCLWEAEHPKDVVLALGKFLDYLTVDCVPVDEIDWAEYAASLAHA
ncbi:MAG: hypothetical protein ABSE08_15145 [Syntrophobacteraceae bacterium]|jgi:hypothetical protein